MGLISSYCVLIQSAYIFIEKRNQFRQASELLSIFVVSHKIDKYI